jgi:hypothetical protein
MMSESALRKEFAEIASQITFVELLYVSGDGSSLEFAAYQYDGTKFKVTLKDILNLSFSRDTPESDNRDGTNVLEIDYRSGNLTASDLANYSYQVDNLEGLLQLCCLTLHGSGSITKAVFREIKVQYADINL